jgi:hypothetical protein
MLSFDKVVEWMRRQHWKNNRKRLASGWGSSDIVGMSGVAGNDAGMAAASGDDGARLQAIARTGYRIVED